MFLLTEAAKVELIVKGYKFISGNCGPDPFSEKFVTDSDDVSYSGIFMSPVGEFMQVSFTAKFSFVEGNFNHSEGFIVQLFPERLHKIEI